MTETRRNGNRLTVGTQGRRVSRRLLVRDAAVLSATVLGAHFYASVDKNALKSALKLRPEQAVIFGQAVGYPNE